MQNPCLGFLVCWHPHVCHKNPLVHICMKNTQIRRKKRWGVKISVFGNKKALPQKSGTQNLEIIEGNCFNLDTRAYNMTYKSAWKILFTPSNSHYPLHVLRHRLSMTLRWQTWFTYAPFLSVNLMYQVTSQKSETSWKT